MLCYSRSEFVRRLVMELITCKQITKLCAYPWNGVRMEVEEVLWWQARTSELLNNDPDRPGKRCVSCS